MKKINSVLAVSVVVLFACGPVSGTKVGQVGAPGPAGPQGPVGAVDEPKMLSCIDFSGASPSFQALQWGDGHLELICSITSGGNEATSDWYYAAPTGYPYTTSCAAEEGGARWVFAITIPASSNSPTSGDITRASVVVSYGGASHALRCQ